MNTLLGVLVCTSMLETILAALWLLRMRCQNIN